MDMKEKLVELLKKAKEKEQYDFLFGDIDTAIDMPHGAEYYADFLIANGVTVQEGKPLEAFLHPVVAHKGLKAKYLVFKADTGESVDNCFILRPDKDPAAVEAIRAYASATDNETLAEDIYNWVGKDEPVQEWISVKDRLPENKSCILMYSADGGVAEGIYDKDQKRWIQFRWGVLNVPSVTHWMPLPQPPKGE